jgi:5-methylcytosine-specific restriction protein A
MSPFAPRRPCPGKGNRCPNLIKWGEKYCPECMPAYIKEKHAQSKEYEQRPERKLMHSRRWRAARLMYLAEHPLCVQCAREGRTTAATDVDHIKPHRGDQALFWTESNWQSLCAHCHAVKTDTQDGGFGNR